MNAPSVKIPATSLRWESPVNVEIVESAAAARAALEEMGLEFERKRTTRLYTKFAIVIMLPRGAYVFQFKVKGEPPLMIETWATEPSFSSRMTWLSVEGFRAADQEKVRQFLELYRRGVAKDPWRFSFGERSRAGYALPEFRQAKKAWASFGFDTSSPRKRG